MESVVLTVPTAAHMHALGRRLAAVLQPGDLVLARGGLGAGKTALTQGIGVGLEVAGPVISPTFVISRVHRPLGQRPGLVHVDAYRLSDLAEVDDLDLDASLDDHVTVVEWGEGKAEQLADHRLDVQIERSSDPEDDTRTVTLAGIGDRWAGVALSLDVTPEEIDE